MTWKCRGVVGVFACLALACGGEAPADAPPPPPPAPAPVTPPEPQPAVRQLFVMTSTNGRLETCLDVTITLAPNAEPPDGGIDGAVERVRATLTTTSNGQTGTEIDRPCSEQFSDRTEWASCRMNLAQNERGSVVFMERYYDFGRAFDTDHFMVECLEQSGDWRAVSRDTPEWLRAQRQHQLEQLQQDARELRRH